MHDFRATAISDAGESGYSASLPRYCARWISWFLIGAMGNGHGEWIMGFLVPVFQFEHVFFAFLAS